MEVQNPIPVVNIGSVLQNKGDQGNSQPFGVIINKISPTQLLVFRLVDKIHPVFSKLEWNPNVHEKCGHLNEAIYSDLKTELLKYYRTRHLSEKEKILLNPVMLEAFPLGIPLFDSKIPEPEANAAVRTIQRGSKIVLNTTNESHCAHLDGENAYVVDMLPNGIWIVIPSSDVNSSNMHFIFYSNSDKNQFGGISRYRIIKEDDSASDVFQLCNALYSQAENPIANLVVNGEKVKVDPKTLRVIYPLGNMTYNSIANTIGNQEEITSRKILAGDDEDDDTILINKKGTNITSIAQPFQLIEDELDDDFINEMSIQSGGKRKPVDDGDGDGDGNINYEDYKTVNSKNVEAEMAINIDDSLNDGLLNKLNLKTDDDYEDDYLINEREPEFESDVASESSKSEASSTIFEDEESQDSGEDIEILEVVQKVERVPKPEEEKVFKDDLQKSELYSMTIENIPVFLRADERLQNVIRKKINAIIKLKNSLMDEGELILPKEDNRPLVTAYMNGDFRNHMLIPLVMNNKKVYIDSKSKANNESFDAKNHFVITKYIQEIDDINYLVDNRKRNTHIEQDTLSQSIINLISPIKNLDKEYGLVIRIGQGLKDDDVSNMSLDTMTIRYCEKPYICQSFEAMREQMDYSVSLGPLQRFIDIEPSSSTLIKVYDHIVNFRQGEKLDIMGFVRLPLSIMNTDTHINDIYNKHEIRKIMLEDVSDTEATILEYPNDIIMYILPANLKRVEDEDTIRDLMNKMIPSASSILRHFESNIRKSVELTHIEQLLAPFGYTLNTLTAFDIQTLIDIQNHGIVYYNQKIVKLQEKFKNHVKSESMESNSSPKIYKFITNEILEELEKLYEDKYKDTNLLSDCESNRFNWVISHSDHGRFLYYYLLSHYYQNTDLEGALNKQSELLKLAQEELDVMFANKKTLAIEMKPQQVEQCHVQLEHIPRIVRYMSEAQLIAENGREITDVNGNIILEGDFAIIKNQRQMFIYTRKIVNGTQMWIREDKNVLLRFLELERQRKAKCEKVDMCVYKDETAECAPATSEPISDDPDIARIQNEVQVYKDEIGYLRNAIKHQKTLANELKLERRRINEQIQIKKQYTAYLEDELAVKHVNISKDVKSVVPCVHFAATKFLFNQRNYTPLQEYQVVKAILRKFENADIQYNIFAIDKDDDNNWVECNICGQHLLCKHYLLGLHQIQNTSDINDEEIRDIYGVENTDSYSCKICGIELSNTDVKEVAEFLRGAGGDGRRKVDREIYEETVVEISSLEQYIESINEDENARAKLEVNFYAGLKQLTGLLTTMTAEDDSEMINYIKTATHTSMEAFRRKIMRERQVELRIAQQFASVLYLQNVFCNIAARFLIILQTSNTEYGIENRFCNKNYYGYPLDPDESRDTGVKFILCLFKQLSSDPQFKVLEKDMTRTLMNAVKNQATNDEYITNKLLNAVSRKSIKVIDNMNFEEHYTNYWNGFLPMLRHIELPAEPDKFINIEDSRVVSAVGAYNKMVMTGRFNGDYLARSIIHMINGYIEDKNPENRYTYASIGNTCCLEKLNPKFKYFQYFLDGEPQIKAYMDRILLINESMNALRNRILTSWFFTKTIASPRPSLNIIPFEMKIDQRDIRDVHLKYVDSGINAGMQHIFDEYGRCIYSNVLKHAVEHKHYNATDFRMILSKIQNYNSFKFPDNMFNSTLADDLLNTEIQLKAIISNMKESPLLEQSLLKLLEIWKDNKNQSDDLKIWTLLNSQIQMDVEGIVNYLTSDVVKKNTLKIALNNLADYKDIYEEDLSNEGYDVASNQRYKRKEHDIRQIFQYLITAVLQVKNKKLVGVKMDNIRPQFQFMYPFKDNVKLFDRIYKFVKPYYESSKMVYGHQYSKYLNLENSCILQHYLIISAIYSIIFGNKNESNMVEMLESDKTAVSEMVHSGGASNISKTKLEKTKRSDKKSKVNVVLEEDEDDEDVDVKGELLSESASVFNKSIVEDDKKEEEIEEENKERDLSRELEMSESADSTIIIEFITRFMKKVEHRQGLFNKLTERFIRLKTAEEKEKQERKNLGNLRKLKFTEGLEEQYKLLMIKLQFKQIEYRDLHEEITQELASLNLDNLAENMSIENMNENPEYIVNDDIMVNANENMDDIQAAREENFMNYNEEMEADYGDGNIEDDADYYD
jgi:hypothetical protein